MSKMDLILERVEEVRTEQKALQKTVHKIEVKTAKSEEHLKGINGKVQTNTSDIKYLRGKVLDNRVALAKHTGAGVGGGAVAIFLWDGLKKLMGF